MIKSVHDYLMAILPYQQRALAQIHRFGTDRPGILFRGKRKSQLLRAKIAGISKDLIRPIAFERESLSLLRRRLGLGNSYTDWDIITLAQHHGIATRFIDWSSNSLVALWFSIGNACNSYEESDASEVYLLETVESDFDVPETEMSPIPAEKGSKTVIFTPKLIDCRIGAQDGYLMRQIYEGTSSNLYMRPIDENPTFSERVHKIHITRSDVIRKKLRDELSKYGYNQSSMMPDDKDWQTLRNECDKLSRFFKSDIQEDK